MVKEGFFRLCCLIILSVANICLCNDEEFRPYGSIGYGLDFSSTSDAKMHYVSDSSTIYTYTNGANSDHLISSIVGFKYTSKDRLEITQSNLHESKISSFK